MAGPESTSRRDFLRTAAGVVAGVAVGMGLERYRNNNEPRPAYFDHAEYVKGFPEVSEERARRLISPVEFNKLALEMKSDEDNFVSTFQADPTKLYGLEVRGILDPNFSIQPVILTIGERKYLAPIIQSAESAVCPLYIGEMEGEQNITFASVNEGETPIVDASLVEISAESFAKEVIRNTPNLHIRKDNKDNLLNDVPLNLSVYFMENFQLGARMSEYRMRYSGESNDHAPHPLAEEYGRVWDRDVVSIMTTTGQGERSEVASMGKGHVMYVDEMYETPELLRWGDRVEYQVIEKNNMVSPDIEMDISCSFIPDQFLDFSNIVKFDREKALQVLSIREYINEGRLAENDSFVLGIIANELDGVNLIYPE